jgi:hypothetical protein
LHARASSYPLGGCPSAPQIAALPWRSNTTTANSAGILYLPLFGDTAGGFNHCAGSKMPQQPKIGVKPSK